MDHTIDRIADAGAAGSILLFGMTLANLNELIQIFAGASAVFAGTAAGLYHLHRWRVELRRERQKAKAKDDGPAAQ